MCHGEVIRRMRLPDLFGQNIATATDSQERKFVLGVVLMTRQGKTNKLGKIQYCVVVRNINVEACPVAYFLSAASPPSLDDPNWINFHFLSIATLCTRKLIYTSQYAAMYHTMQALGVGGGWKGKATHLGRRQGAFFACMCGAGIEEIAKHGNWSKSRLVTHYLDGVDASVAL
ncbi:hypothetical protein FBU30_000286 [Linnemannia zychae]|nr:hypothetical protein FBU30_000286 [Linnemannia zychae]